MSSELKPANIVLEAKMGSHAYGMATPESDIDLLGVYVAPNELFLGVDLPNKGDLTAHKVSEELDFTYHEVAKFCGMVLGCNPTATELLYVTEEEYTVMSEVGRLLIDNRHLFLSKKAFYAFGGYAFDQAKELESRRDEDGNASYASNLKKKFAKHTRHCFRLLAQGEELCTTGTMTVRVTDPAKLFALGESDPDTVIATFKEAYAKYRELTCILPDEPDREAVNKLVLKIRGI